MGLTKITSRILDSSGVTILGTIATGVWQGTAINQTYLVGQSGTNTGDETLARINALDVTELGTISSGVWNGTAIASAYLDADTAHLSTTQTFTGAKTFSSSVAVGGWIIPNGVNALTADSSHTYLQQPSGGDILLRKSDGTSFVTITNGGNVGIGTASPFGVTSNRISLSVNGTTSSVVNIGTGNAQRGFFYAESDKVLLNTASAIPLILGANNTNHLTIASGGTTTLNMAYTGGSTGMLNLVSTGSESGMVVKNSSGDGFKLGASGTSFFIYDEQANHQPLTILANSNVGIGTTSPTSKLEVIVTQSDTMTDDTAAFAIKGNGGDGLLMGQRSTSPYAAWIAAGYLQNIGTSHNYPLALQPHGGNVGIGTTSPTTALTIRKEIASAAYGQQASMIEFKSYFPAYDTETVKSAIYSGVSSTGSLNTEGGFLAFHVNNNGTMGEKLRIDKSGNVGIGTTSPDYQLDIENSSHAVLRLHAGTNSSASLRLKNDAVDWDVNTQTNDHFAIYNHTSSIQPFTIAPDGKITIAGAAHNQLTIKDNASYMTLGADDSVMVGITFNRSSSEAWFVGPHRPGATGITNELNFSRLVSGAWNHQMAISSAGYVTKPKQPAFKAGRSANYNVTAGQYIIFDDIQSSSGHFNIGNCYSNNNGVFTAPIAGRYIFSAVVIYMNMSSGQTMADSFTIRKNNVLMAYSARRSNYVVNETGSGGYYVDHGNVLLELATNDSISLVSNYSVTVHGNSKYTYFYGYLLG